MPRKNIRPLMGLPLIVHSIRQAQSCDFISGVYVSTDDQEIADIAADAGATVPFLRPSHMAGVKAPKLPVIAHLIEHLTAQGIDFDAIIDLDPTSPLRSTDDIRNAYEMLDDDTDTVITGYLAEKNPYFNMVEPTFDGQVGLVKPPSGSVTSRQEAPKVWSMNGSVYVWHKDTLPCGLWDGRTRLYEMPHERSVDIDSELDFRLVELLMQDRLDPCDA